jgi:hypothetical protein
VAGSPAKAIRHDRWLHANVPVDPSDSRGVVPKTITPLYETSDPDEPAARSDEYVENFHGDL